MAKQVQIPEDIFKKLIMFHILGNTENQETISRYLEEKLERLVQHDLYATYKTAQSEEEREKARIQYLDHRGIPDAFRK